MQVNASLDLFVVYLPDPICHKDMNVFRTLIAITRSGVVSTQQVGEKVVTRCM